MRKENLLGFDRGDLERAVLKLGEKPFRGRQLFHQLYGRKTTDLAEMTELPQAFRAILSEHHQIRLPVVARREVSFDGTTKLLLRLEDGKHVETVYIPEGRRNTLCLSSQVGCDVGCKFCLTAQMGFDRNLRVGEILGQVIVAVRECGIPDKGLNLVFMGMGEPLYNYQNVMKAFRLLIDPETWGLSHRRITLSTSGVVPVLRRLKTEPVLPNLAISLNATDDRLRTALMPINAKWNLTQLISVCREFSLEPRRRITFEYILMADVTDRDSDALQLVRWLKGVRSKVNLIPYNPNPGLPFRRPADSRVERFRRILVENRMDAFVRKSRGRDISAACGQLAYIEVNPD